MREKYNVGANAYDYSYAQSERLEEQQRSDFQVYENITVDPQVSPVSPKLVRSFGFAVFAAILLFAIGFVMVRLSAGVTELRIQSRALSVQIDSAVAAGENLEIQQGILSNDSKVQLSASEALNMAPAVQQENIDLTEDVLATDSTGTLSLDGSLKASAAQ